MARGTLRIYLGRRARRGQDLRDAERGHAAQRAAGPTSWSGSSRPTVARTPQAQIGDLEVVPRQHVTYRGAHVRGDGRRRRHRPQARAWRWSTSSRTPTCPVRATRSAGRTSRSSSTPGIDVISTVNVQHLESMNDVVEQITGIKQRETDPRRRRARGGPDRDRRHDAAGAAAPDGARQHLPGREGRRVARQLLPRRATSARCVSSR